MLKKDYYKLFKFACEELSCDYMGDAKSIENQTLSLFSLFLQNQYQQTKTTSEFWRKAYYFLVDRYVKESIKQGVICSVDQINDVLEAKYKEKYEFPSRVVIDLMQEDYENFLQNALGNAYYEKECCPSHKAVHGRIYLTIQSPQFSSLNFEVRDGKFIPQDSNSQAFEEKTELSRKWRKFIISQKQNKNLDK